MNHLAPAGPLTGLALLSMGLHLRAALRGPRWQVYLFKPLTTTLLLSLAALLPVTAGGHYRAAILAGLVLSLAGDVLLMLPGDRFVAGLASFLLAHLLYIVAFTEGTGFGITLWILLPYYTAAAWVLHLLWPHLGRLKAPVTVYVGVILVMAAQAAERAHALGTRGAGLAAAGALLFLVSDTALAFRRFRRPFPGAQALVTTNYVLAQWLIALSVGA